MRTLLLLLIAATPLYEMSSDTVDDYLGALAVETPSYTARVETLARAACGTPYANGPLGEGPDGKYDRDPLMDLSKVDCVTYVEQVLALASAATYQEAFDHLQRIRYRAGRIGFETRNHFMVADWLANNAWCRDVSDTLGVDTESLTRTINRKDFFELVDAPGLGQDVPPQEVTIEYVPGDRAAAAAKKLSSPTLIVFIGKKPEWLFALHTGLYARDDQGTPHLYHASSQAEHVVETDLAQYLSAQAERYLGFTAHAITPPPFAK